MYYHMTIIIYYPVLFIYLFILNLISSPGQVSQHLSLVAKQCQQNNKMDKYNKLLYII